ncbi:MAG: transposase [Candidatus Humimicrobiaceae bacterium]
MNMQGILGTEKGNEIICAIQNSKNENILDVYFGTRHLTSINKEDNEAKKILVAFLANSGVKKVAISRAFSINPCLVTRYSKQFSLEGMASLVKDRRGRPGKVDEKIAAFVSNEYKILKKKRVKSIRPVIAQKVKERFGVDISKEIIRVITLPLRENKPVLKEPLKNIAPARENGNEDKLSLKLKKGFYSRYGAGLILNVFISKLTKGVLEGYSNIRQGLDLKTFMIMIMQMVSFDIINIERVKKIAAHQFGLLMGIVKSPNLKTARRKLAEAVEKIDTEKISAALASNYLDNLSCGTDLFYIDDHLDTYSGKVKVLSGFSHIYDRMMEGTQHTFIHDRWGNPICFTLRDNFVPFKDYLPVMVKRIKKMYKKKLTFVFDRGGYDRKIFLKFESLGACYIVWAKGDKRDYSKEDLDFSQHTVHLKANTEKKPRKAVLGLAEIASENKKQRKIIIRRETQRRAKEYKDYMYSSLVTNDMARPAFEVVEAIIYRWRQECDFKIEKQEFGIDQITSYSMKDYKDDIFNDSTLSPELTSERMMANPMLRPLRSTKAKIKRDIAKIDEKMGRFAFAKTKKRDRTIAEVAELKRSQADLSKREKLVLELKEVEDSIAILPREINRLDYLIGKKFKVFDFRKKLIVDTLKVCARNARKMALEVLDRHYHNYRDQLDFSKRIITNGGYVRLNDKGTVIVEITAFNTKKENEALGSFLKEINSMNPHMFGESSYPIKFKVGKT